ncbi:hypothetical protein AB0P19_02275 [Microbacterium oleivorans]|uniref:VG15 protein n=1 Tax=Microbacterium oleivorans TaxID=273677 RepID=UPI0034176BB3
MLPQSAVDHYQQQQLIAVAAAENVTRMWAAMSNDFDTSWATIAAPVTETVSAAQAAAAATGAGYVAAVLEETDVDAPAVATVAPRAFAGVAPDGRQLTTLLQGSTIRAKEGVAAGLAPELALAAAGGWLQDVVLDSVRSANRAAVAAAITVRPAVQGWVRMLNPPSCKFCITLAGKWFRWNEGFKSHTHCDCRHIPAQESAAGDLTVDPYAYFRSLDGKAQDRLFGKADAQAIRDGGDIYRVVNTRSRGLSTSRRSRKFGTPSRMTVDDVYAAVSSRDEAIRLLAREGYVTGPQRAGGNFLGNEPTDASVLAAGRGRGTYRVGSETVTTNRAARFDAVASGQRDPDRRSTMTAGERRIYDDFYRAEQALLFRKARTIGGNSADRGTVFTSLNEDEADVLRMTFIRRIDRVRRNGTAQEKRMAERLWARYNALI